MRRRLLSLFAALIVLILCSFLILGGQTQSQNYRTTAVTFFNEMQPDFEEWKDAKVADQGIPLYRPDLQQVAYYEFPVVRGQGGTPAGFIIVSTGSHDHRIPQWSTKGETHISQLQNAEPRHAHNIKQYYRRDLVTYAAEDSQGNLLAQLGERDRKLNPAQWKTFKRDFARTNAVKLTKIRHKAASQWQRTPRSFSINNCGDWHTYWAGKYSDQRWYDQIPSGTPPNNSGCWSGCGATAWAMLFGWADYKASQHDPVWSSSYNLYGPYSGGADVAPAAMDANVKNMIWQIKGYLGTSCSGDQGLTYPWNMDRAHKYLDGRSDSAFDLNTYTSTDENDRADGIIKDGTPTIILMNFDHYPLAFGYTKRNCTFGSSHYFYVNLGWGGGPNGATWTADDTEFVGELVPYPSVPPHYDPCIAQGKHCGLWDPNGHCAACIAAGEPPPPNPFRGCPAGRKCCEPGDNGKPCKLCIPVNAQCP